ncbi:MAG: hypothetical protein AAB472_01765 [Patescibacteria group bacterium]
MRKILLFVIVMFFATTKSYAQEVSNQSTPQVQETVAQTVTDKLFQFFSQGDPAWRHARLGRSTIGRKGCLVTSLSMAAFHAGDTSINPLLLVQDLEAKGLVTKEGRIVPTKLGTALPLTPVARVRVTDATVAALIEAELKQGRFVVLRLNHSASGKAGQHWVYALKVENGDIFVADPGRGYCDFLKNLYGKIAVAEMLVLEKNS